jgi:predicted 3-demethylubiquinone-9 3-methyltransferase (glyoxalase superfamily)
MPKITPCLWFDTQAEEAARFYCSIFQKSKIGRISR